MGGGGGGGGHLPPVEWGIASPKVKPSDVIESYTYPVLIQLLLIVASINS